MIDWTLKGRSLRSLVPQSGITRLITPYLTQEAKKDYAVLFLTALSLLFFGIWGIGPLLSNIASLHSELKSGEAYETALTEKIVALNQGKENLARITEKMEALNNAIPDDPSQAELIEELSIDGGRARFSFTSILFKGREAGNGINYESFECSLKGSSTGFIRLLEEIIKGRLVMIESLQYSQGTAETEDILEVMLRGKSFYYQK